MTFAAGKPLPFKQGSTAVQGELGAESEGLWPHGNWWRDRDYDSHTQAHRRPRVMVNDVSSQGSDDQPRARPISSPRWSILCSAWPQAKMRALAF